MKRQSSLATLSTSIILMAMLLILVGVIAANFQLRSYARTHLQDTLVTVLDNTEETFEDWAERQIASVQFWPRDARFHTHVNTLLAEQPDNEALVANPAQSALRSLFRSWLTDGGYLGYFVISPDGVNLASSRDQNIGVQSLVLEQNPNTFQDVLSGKSLVTLPLISDLPGMITPGESRWVVPTMFVMAPIFDQIGNVKAIFAARLDPARSFSSVFQSGRSGLTGETYAIDSMGRMISESRFKPQLIDAGLLAPGFMSSLNVTVRNPGRNLTTSGDTVAPDRHNPLTVMAESALSGNDGMNLEGYNDYRGVPVVGVWRWNEDYQMAIATELDLKEAYANLEVSLFTLYTFAVLCAIILGLVLFASFKIRGRIASDARQLGERQELLQRILNGAGEGIYGLDAEGITTFVNPKACEILGYSEKELIGQPLHPLVHHSYASGKPYPREDCYMYRAFTEGRIYRISDEVFWRKDGTSMPVTYVCTPILHKGKVTGAVVLFEDNTEAVETRQTLEAAREEAVASNKAKSTFLTSMSHELRTPLNAILGFAQVLQNDPRDMTEEQVSFAEEILSSGGHLLELINEVLELSKIDAGELSLSIENVHPDEVIEDCVSMTSMLASKHGVQVVNRASEMALPIVVTDYLRFKQIMINLMSNAMKYNLPNGTVTIEAEPLDGGYLRIHIIDTGRGIPQERLDELWEPFNRLGAEATRIEGTGIGLSLCKRIVELLGGRIGVTSVIGEGSTFWFDLPTLIEKSYTKTKRPAKWTDPGYEDGSYDFSDFSGMKVLYVEDNPSNQTVMKSILHQETGVTLKIASTVSEGLLRTEEFMPDLILLDINLPDFDGLTFKRRHGRNSMIAHIPVVALTANISRTMQTKAMKLGFYDFLTKPLYITELYNCMTRVQTHLRADTREGNSPEDVAKDMD